MTVRIEVADGIGTLTLNDPEKRNALTGDMVRRITEAFDEFEASDVGAVIVTGAPPAFCAGANLSDLGAEGTQSRERGLRSIYEGFLRVARSPLPTIAAVNGAAVGAGMNLALCCDVRIAARRARFDTRFVQLGIHPGGGHTWMLERTIGYEATAAMVLFGEVLDGQAAASAGLVWRCVDDDALMSNARELAARAVAAPHALVRKVKDTMRAIVNVDHHEQAVDMEIEAQMWSQRQPEFAQRLADMQRKISGRFSG